MNNNLVTIVALSVDTRYAVLYFQDGSTLTLAQGDARLPGIVSASKELLAQGKPAAVDITPVHIVRSEFGAAEKGTGGVIKFFKVAKSFLKKLVNTESPVAVPEEVAYISPLSIGVFPGQPESKFEVVDSGMGIHHVPKEATNQGTKEEDEPADPTPAVADEATATQKENATTGQATLVYPTNLSVKVDPATGYVREVTNAEKLAVAKDRMQQLVGNSVGTERAEFHTPLDEKTETIVALHTETGAIVPDAQKLARHLRQSEKLQNYAGFTRFIERLSAIIDQRGHSVEDLMKFIEKGDLPIADDGSIVIYKKLNRAEKGVFVDVHTGKIRQKVGSYVYLLPHLVDPNRRNSCSNGLHVGVMSYVRSFSGNVTIMAKLRPEDVFAVPEYEHTKMRVAGYHILAELPDRLRQLVDQGVSISQDPEGAVLLNNVLRGNHIGITQLVEVGGHSGTNVTYTDTGLRSAEQIPAPISGAASALDMTEALEAKLPVAPDVKAEDLVKPAVEAPETPAEQPHDLASIIFIMSNDPKETLGDKAESTVESTGTLSQKDKATALLQAVNKAKTEIERAAAAQDLKALKKQSRKSWTALGLPENTAVTLDAVLGAKPAPVNAPKPVKAVSKSTPKGQKTEVITTGDKQTEALALLDQGLSNIEVARKTGLSKDQVYRLKKKLAA
jgi:hypothetical protein